MREQSGGYLPIEDYGLIGNMRTCALVGMDGSVDFMCWWVTSLPMRGLKFRRCFELRHRPKITS